MTSNLGRARPSRSSARDAEAMEREVRKVLEGHFKPEFLNRIDEVIIFRPLGKEAILRIVGLQLELLAKRLADRKIGLEVGEGGQGAPGRAGLRSRSTGPGRSSGPSSSDVQDPLAMKILAGEYGEGDTVAVGVDKAGELDVRQEVREGDAGRAGLVYNGWNARRDTERPHMSQENDRSDSSRRPGPELPSPRPTASTSTASGRGPRPWAGLSSASPTTSAPCSGTRPARRASSRRPSAFTRSTSYPGRPTAQWPITLEVPEIDAKTKVSHYLGGLAAYYKPISSRVVVGLGIGTPSGLGTTWDGADFTEMTGGTAYDLVEQGRRLLLLAAHRRQGQRTGCPSGPRSTSTTATSTSRCLAGRPTWARGSVDLGQYEENMNGWGFGATFGVLVKPVDKLGIGLTVRTPSTVSFKGSARMSYLSLYDLPDTSDLTRKITWPLWIAGGVSFRPVERLLLSADVHWTQWSKLDRITTEYLESIWATLMMEGEPGHDVRVLDWKNATQIRFGAEYTLNATTALRAGYYNDPAPGPLATMNLLLPSHTYNAFSLGVGKTIGDLQLDFGLEYLAGQGPDERLGLHGDEPMGCPSSSRRSR
ncbi:MAG: outer membrane protein transport protein [Desulfomicrobium escambiense]|nr:outer membrane protein transport protein [Desulfomicrobium escambiense]